MEGGGEVEGECENHFMTRKCRASSLLPVLLPCDSVPPLVSTSPSASATSQDNLPASPDPPHFGLRLTCLPYAQHVEQAGCVGGASHGGSP